MLNPRALGFPDEDSVTSPQMKRPPFGRAKKAPAPTKATPPGQPIAADHPANTHLQNALGATDHAAKQKHVFRALSAIRKAAVTK